MARLSGGGGKPQPKKSNSTNSYYDQVMAKIRRENQRKIEEEIPLPSGDTATRNPIDVAPVTYIDYEAADREEALNWKQAGRDRARQQKPPAPSRDTTIQNLVKDYEDLDREETWQMKQAAIGRKNASRYDYNDWYQYYINKGYNSTDADWQAQIDSQNANNILKNQSDYQGIDYWVPKDKHFQPADQFICTLNSFNHALMRDQYRIAPMEELISASLEGGSTWHKGGTLPGEFAQNEGPKYGYDPQFIWGKETGSIAARLAETVLGTVAGSVLPGTFNKINEMLPVDFQLKGNYLFGEKEVQQALDDGVSVLINTWDHTKLAVGFDQNGDVEIWNYGEVEKTSFDKMMDENVSFVILYPDKYMRGVAERKEAQANTR